MRNQPLGGNDMPRFAGPGTMMRLPAAESADGLDACFVGVPLDIGTSNRSGTRFGPKQMCFLAYEVFLSYRKHTKEHRLWLPKYRSKLICPSCSQR